MQCVLDRNSTHLRREKVDPLVRDRTRLMEWAPAPSVVRQNDGPLRAVGDGSFWFMLVRSNEFVTVDESALDGEPAVDVEAATRKYDWYPERDPLMPRGDTERVERDQG